MTDKPQWAIVSAISRSQEFCNPYADTAYAINCGPEPVAFVRMLYGSDENSPEDVQVSIHFMPGQKGFDGGYMLSQALAAMYAAQQVDSDGEFLLDVVQQRAPIPFSY